MPLTTHFDSTCPHNVWPNVSVVGVVAVHLNLSELIVAGLKPKIRHDTYSKKKKKTIIIEFKYFLKDSADT